MQIRSEACEGTKLGCERWAIIFRMVAVLTVADALAGILVMVSGDKLKRSARRRMRWYATACTSSELTCCSDTELIVYQCAQPCG
jgi:hypothetical protein